MLYYFRVVLLWVSPSPWVSFFIFFLYPRPCSHQNGTQTGEPESRDRGEAAAAAAVPGAADEAGAPRRAGARLEGRDAGRRQAARAQAAPERLLEDRRGLGHGDPQEDQAQQEQRVQAGGVRVSWRASGPEVPRAFPYFTLETGEDRT